MSKIVVECHSFQFEGENVIEEEWGWRFCEKGLRALPDWAQFNQETVKIPINVDIATSRSIVLYITLALDLISLA